MEGKSPTRLLITFLLVALTAAAMGTVRAAQYPAEQLTERNEVQEVSFSLAPQPENPKHYILAISDDNERSISGSFSVDQLQILRALMVEAEKFAITGESAGTTEPITTRFLDNQELAFVVDVQKDGRQSLLFLTVKTEIGRMTWRAGKIIRSTTRKEGFFFALLSRVESTLPKLKQSPK
jgi:hypothetical protein